MSWFETEGKDLYLVTIKTEMVVVARDGEEAVKVACENVGQAALELEPEVAVIQDESQLSDHMLDRGAWEYDESEDWRSCRDFLKQKALDKEGWWPKPGEEDSWESQ